MHFSRWLWSDRKSLYMWASAIILESQEEKWTSRISQYICDPILCCIGSCFYHQVSIWSSQLKHFAICIVQFSGLLVFLMLRAFDCDAFPNCWFPPHGHEAHIQKQSKFPSLWKYDNLFYRNYPIWPIKWYQANWK